MLQWPPMLDALTIPGRQLKQTGNVITTKSGERFWNCELHATEDTPLVGGAIGEIYAILVFSDIFYVKKNSLGLYIFLHVYVFCKAII